MTRAHLQQRYNSMHQQVLSCQAESRSIEEQLEFVREKKEELKSIKNDFKTNKQDATLVDLSISIMQWRGSNYGLYHDEYIRDLVNDKYTKLIGDIDQNLDALVSEERRLENRLLDNQGLIGKLRQGLNWITSELEKLVN